jgi:hypothetical protein
MGDRRSRRQRSRNASMAAMGWLQAKCHRCETEASFPLEHVRRPRDTPIWKLEAALKCRSCRTPCYLPRVHMIKLTMQREIAPYKWAHPDDDERRLVLARPTSPFYRKPEAHRSLEN